MRRVGGHLVTTVFDLMLAQYGVGRDGPAGRLADRRTTTPASPYTPGLAGGDHRRPGRDRGPDRPRVRAERRGVPGPLDDPDGRRHQPLVPLRHDLPRASSTLTNLTGCQGVNGGGWAHYVGQEKCRPITGYAQLAFALDWNRPPRQMIQTAYWYLHTDQFRYDQFGADTLSATTGKRPARRARPPPT